MSRIRIFVSFDRAHDADLRDLLRAESTRPGSTFELAARSEGGSLSEAWTARSRAHIRASDEVVVLCGEHTSESARVAAELRIAREEGKPYLLVWGRRERMCTKPDGATAADAMYSWTGDILNREMTAALRKSRPVEVPASCRRRSP